jgi:hypothetical protein
MCLRSKDTGISVRVRGYQDLAISELKPLWLGAGDSGKRHDGRKESKRLHLHCVNTRRVGSERRH